MTPEHFTQTPFDLSTITAYDYTSMPSDMKTNEGLSYESATYRSTTNPLPTELDEFSKQFTLLSQWFRKQRKLFTGPTQDIFFKRYFQIMDLSLTDVTAECKSIVMTYPG